MGLHLPLEILHLIAIYLQDAKASLVICTRVCREWQVAFEALIYSRPIHVISADGVSKDDCERSMSLSHFQNVTSGKGLARRALIQHLSYHIVVPSDLPDWQTRKRKGYKVENNIRHENDLAFQSAILDLFKTLKWWDPYLRLSVEVALLGREPGIEPHTYDWDIAGEYCYDYKEGRTQSVPVYRARFLDNAASFLPDVACIDRLCFDDDFPFHRIWAGSALQIAQRCSTLTQMILNLDEYIRPDHIEYIQARRQGQRNIYFG
ncbi:hypothetical protein PENSUB_6797 [Penicillium subrubescens]|uniref:F-box domain-containing protein n=1 Tax=Penicillium subrubescens TaxID=1316194 RepID=A0A1Q5TU73_9EURO|nr:hypothetical protein PENSUB_6797 [Penicillium subrubescens]